MQYHHIPHLHNCHNSSIFCSVFDTARHNRNAKQPVAHIAIPLGAHQDASKGHGAVKAPKPTINDQSTEASAVRADGTHNTVDNLVDIGGGSPAPLHMPHVA
jgi:hypothetical protein